MAVIVKEIGSVKDKINNIDCGYPEVQYFCYYTVLI